MGLQSVTQAASSGFASPAWFLPPRLPGTRYHRRMEIRTNDLSHSAVLALLREMSPPVSNCALDMSARSDWVRVSRAP